METDEANYRFIEQTNRISSGKLQCLRHIVSQSGHSFMALADKFIALGLGQRRILLRNRAILI